MRIFILFAFFIYSNFIIGQGASLIPPDYVINAFEKQYPKKKAVWEIEYGEKNDDLTFIAKFTKAPKTIAFAYYDQNGVFKVCKVQMPSIKLGKKIQTYLKANYSVKSVKEVFSVIDYSNIKSFEVGVIKDSKSYNLIFDQDGEFLKRIRIR
ncbi:hypothetical protein [Flavobacterium phragmitis]|uniref:Beta-lactamase-inhibitor-like, PepSY-like n=1 Tax=Flavobacterium phragmitis TaxID=739143 RepID=A0A1I1QNE4_9FLAO|nr:hypothetical protein [Flavobacterium phragmitis]SFD21368.1 hypothetical protein SAMN05216297_105298 [Flavobacterium phragmitis]